MNYFIDSLHIVLLFLLLRLCYTDVHNRIISNRVVMALLFVVVPLSLLRYQSIFFIPALCTLFIGFVLFILHIIGAGDIKLISVLMLMIPYEQIIFFFFFTAIAGLLLIIIGWLFYRKSIKARGLPYGVAISLGFLTNLALSSVPSA
jgi:tadV